MEQQPTTDSENTRWYVLSANYKKELAVRDELRARGFEAYVPMQYALAQVQGRRERVLRPAAHGLVFARATIDQLRDYKHSSRNNPYVFFRMQRVGGRLVPLFVRDDDMDNFMRLTGIAEAKLTYFRPEELHLAKGERIRIMDGIFEGIEGVVQRLPHKRGDYLVVDLPGVSVVAARIKPGYVQPVERRVARSQNVDADVTRLAALALRLLYELPADGPRQAERGIVAGELQVVRRALEGCKTFLAADRAAYALAHYLAARALGEPTLPHAERLRPLWPRLSVRSLLRMRICLYLALDHADTAAADSMAATLARWDDSRYTAGERAFLTEKMRAEKAMRK